ncbi:hypothetical protein C8R46DRAFT_1299032 [Mycena filopes]|nr:hypothetical protein C8R46DRAFT_1299032 [Mycena filopes]
MVDVARTMDAADLARWTRFAAKGGIGKCTAIGDCVAEAAEDLMFLKNDEIVVLMQLPEENLFLGYCEGIVGRFHANDVHFHSKLKKPVMTKRSSVSAASVSGNRTPTPSMLQSPSPSLGYSPNPRLGSNPQSSASPSQLRYQPPPSPPSPSQDRIPRSTGLSSTTVSNGSASASQSSSSHSSAVPDTPGTVYSSPEPIPPKPLDTSTSTASIDTNVSGRSSTYLASAASRANGLDGDAGEGPDGSPGRNRRSETTTVEMWPAASPSSAIARKPINGSRLALTALTIQPPDDSEESSDEATGIAHRRLGSSDSEGYDPEEGGWARTLPLQVVKINSPNPNSAPPSPYQSFASGSSPRPQTDTESTPSRSRSESFNQTDFSKSPNQTDSESDYNSDPEDHNENDETTRFSLPSERRSSSPPSVANHRRTPSVSGSLASHTSSRVRSSGSSSLMHEERTRLSIAASSLAGSEDGEVGIGLSLLQGMLGGGGASDSESEDEPTPPAAIEAVPEPEIPLRGMPGPPEHGYDSDGASDIYENYYRFSKFSTNQRSSASTFASTSGPPPKMPSRLSQSSQHAVAGPSSTIVPPVPVDSHPEDPPLEFASTRSQKTRSVDSDASIYTQASNVSSRGRRPAPLHLAGVNGDPTLNTPLLHTRWGSPLSSASPPTSSAAGQTSFYEGTPPPSASSGSISPGGAASLLRQRIELDRSSPSSNHVNLEVEQPEEQEGEGLGSRIVIEDDEEPPAPSVIDDLRSESPESEVSAEVDHEDDTASKRPGPDSLTPLVINDDSLSPPPNSTAPTSASASPQSPLSTATTTPLSPSSPPDLAPPPSQPAPSFQRQPRPSLSELRGYAGDASSSAGNAWDAPAQRTSIFLPHPNAPKPPPMTGAAEGPMYIRAPPPPSQRHTDDVANIIRMSIGRSAVTRVMPTIYGRTDADLKSSTGPVRMVFSIDPLPPLTAPLPSQIPFRNGASPPVPLPRRRMTNEERSQPVSPTPSPRNGGPPGRSNPSPSATTPAVALPSKSSPLAEKAADPRPIPRPNFFPKAGTSRPRSRSFSGFNSITDKSKAVQGRRLRASYQSASSENGSLHVCSLSACSVISFIISSVLVLTLLTVPILGQARFEKLPPPFSPFSPTEQ